MPMPRLPDRIILEPKPVTGPLLAMALGLDRAQPGYFRYLTTASALKRQVNFIAPVLVHLSEEHGREAGRWYLEHGFGKLDGPVHPIFNDLDEAQDWVAQRFG